MRSDWDIQREPFLLAAIERSRFTIVASDLRLPDQPLVFVNDAFEHLTGYPRSDSVGVNCRFLQGPRTDPETVARIRATIAAGEDGYFEILNYRKDGTPFWNGLHLSPVANGTEAPALYVGYHRDVTAEVEARARQDLLTGELRHRLGNLMAIVGMIVRTSRGGDGEESLRKVLEGRIHALTASNELVFPKRHSGDGAQTGIVQAGIVQAGAAQAGAAQAGISLRALLETVLKPIGQAGRIVLRGPDLSLSEKSVTNVALAIHELSTNAMKYGALSNDAGRIEIAWRPAGDLVLIDWRETGIAAAQEDGVPDRRGMGSRLLASIASASCRADAGLDRQGPALDYRFDAALRGDGS